MIFGGKNGTSYQDIMIFGGMNGKLPSKNSCAEAENDEMGFLNSRDRSRLN